MSIYVLGAIFVILLVVDFVSGSARSKGGSVVSRVVQGILAIGIVYFVARFFYFHSIDKDSAVNYSVLLLDLLILTRIVDFLVRKNLG
jgi:hypothetical protein